MINKRIYPTDHYKRNNKSAIYYNSMQWRNLRNYYIHTHPLCERCYNIYGRSVPAEEVHHKKEFLKGQTEQERWQLLTDPDNLMSLCSACHHEIHNERKSL